MLYNFCAVSARAIAREEAGEGQHSAHAQTGVSRLTYCRMWRAPRAPSSRACRDVSRESVSSPESIRFSCFSNTGDTHRLKTQSDRCAAGTRVGVRARAESDARAGCGSAALLNADEFVQMSSPWAWEGPRPQEPGSWSDNTKFFRERSPERAQTQ